MKSTGQRWWIVALLFLAAVLNYVDKNSLALLAPTIQQDLGLSDQDYATVVALQFDSDVMKLPAVSVTNAAAKPTTQSKQP